MADKFNRETERLKAKGVLMRGPIVKKKGQYLKPEEVETLSDEAIEDMVAVDAVERVAIKAGDGEAGEAEG